MPTETFRSAEAYRKSRAYTHIHGIPTHAEYVVVGGKKHKVKHRRKAMKHKANDTHVGVKPIAMKMKAHATRARVGGKKAPKRKRG